MAKQEYQFRAREGARFSDKKANVYGQHILNLMQKKGKSSLQQITPKEILQDARKKDTPYHDEFEWDDSKAAEEYRLDQARSIISSIVEVKIIHGEEKNVRVFCNVITPSGDRAYMPTEIVIKSPKLVSQVVAEALGEVKIWKDKYASIYELGKITGAINETLEAYDFK